MPTGLPVAPRGKDCDSSTRCLILGATIPVHAGPARSSSAATGPRTSRFIKLGSLLPAAPPQAPGHSFSRFNFLTIRAQAMPVIEQSPVMEIDSDDEQPVATNARRDQSLYHRDRE